jgi:hypothetical protein
MLMEMLHAPAPIRSPQARCRTAGWEAAAAVPLGEVMLTQKSEQIEPLVLSNTGGPFAAGERRSESSFGTWVMGERPAPMCTARLGLGAAIPAATALKWYCQSSAEQVINLDRENERAFTTEMLRKGIKDL